MTEQEFYRRLNEIESSDSDGLAALANDVNAHSRQPVSTVLAEWRTDPARLRINCAYICSHLKELAVGEMLEEADGVAAVTRVQLLDMVVSQQLKFRELMLTALEPLLVDHASAGLEDSDLRANDIAYLGARKLVSTKEAEARLFSSAQDFKALDANQRDTEIETWLLSETWLELFPQTP